MFYDFRCVSLAADPNELEGKIEAFSGGDIVGAHT